MLMGWPLGGVMMSRVREGGKSDLVGRRGSGIMKLIKLGDESMKVIEN